MVDKAEDGVGLISSRLIHDGRVVHLSVDRVRFPDGKEGELELIRHKGATAIVPLMGGALDPDPEVVLIRQYRYAAQGFVFEIPAGLREEGESWEACAQRELEEETGYLGAEFRLLTSIFTTPGFTNEVIHLFLATGLTPGKTRRDHDEFIEVIHLPLAEALAMVGRGEIADAKSIAGLLFVDRFLRGES
jgi:ADP-ribose pyrophosphatase